MSEPPKTIWTKLKNSKIYKSIIHNLGQVKYKLVNALNFFIKEFLVLIYYVKKTLRKGVVEVLGLIFPLYELYKDYRSGDFWTAINNSPKELIHYVIIYLSYLTISIVVRFAVKKRGGDYAKSIKNQFDTTLKRIQIKHTTELQEDNLVTNCDVKIKTLLKLNKKAYRGTIWYMHHSQKEKSFRAHITANKWSIAFVYSEETVRKETGYTHAIPVNIYTWHKFLNGNIKDEQFDYSSVIPEPEKIKYLDETPFGIIFFSAACPRRNFLRCNARKINDTRSKQLSISIAMHLNKFISEYFKKSQTIPTIFLTLDRKVLKVFKNNIVYKKNVEEGTGKIVSLEFQNSNPVQSEWIKTVI